MFKGILIGVGCVTLGLTMLFGWPTMSSYVETGAKMVKEKAQSAVPFEVEISRLETMVDNLDGVIASNEKKLIAQEVDLEYLEREINEKGKQVEVQKTTLKKINGMLNKGHDVYRVGGVDYSYEQVNRDALHRIAMYKSADGLLEVRKQTLTTLNEAMEMSRSQIGEAKQKRKEYADMIAQLKADNVKLMAKKELASTVEGIKLADTENAFTEVNDLYARLHKQIDVENKLLDSQIGLAKSNNYKIDYDEPESRDATAELAEIFPDAKEELAQTLGEIDYK